MARAAWPLVGRDGEVAELRRAVNSGTGAVVIGEAGVGKTRLVEEVLSRSGREVLAVVGAEAAAGIPLGAFSHLIGAKVAAGAALHELIGQAVRRIEDRVGRGILFVDDAHYLDPASLTLLVQLVSSAGLLVLATTRPPPSPEIVTLWKDGKVHRLDLAPLDRNATAALSRQVLDEAADDELLERLWSLSRGNVLFLRELVLAAVEARRQGVAGDRIPLSALDDPSVRLRELVGARLTWLAPNLLEALELVAAGEPLPLPLAERLVESSDLEELEVAGLMRVESGGLAGGAVRTFHPLHGEVLRARMATLRRRGHLRRILKAAVEVEGEVDPLRLATWRLEAGDADDGQLLAAGAWEALRRFDPQLAERLARPAFERGNTDAGLALAEALMGQRRPDEADSVLDRISPESDVELSVHAISRSANHLWQRGDPRSALAVLEAAEGQLEASPGARAECAGHRAQVLFISGRFEKAQDVAAEVLSDPHASGAASLRAGLVAAPAWAAAGRLDEVLGAIESWLGVAEATPVSVARADPLLRTVRFMALIWAGRAHEAEALAADDLGLEVDDPPPGLLGVLTGTRGRAALARGRSVTAQAFLHEAAQMAARDDWLGLRPWFLAFLGRAQVYAGDLEGAKQSVEAADEASSHLGRGSVSAVLAAGDIELTRVWLAAAEGAHTEAVARAREVRVENGVPLPVALEALHAIVRLGHAAEVDDEVRRVADQVEGPLAPLVARHAEVAITRDPRGLAEVADGFADLGLDLLALETISAAADAYRSEGRHGSALSCDEQALALRKGCDVAAPPALTTVFGDRSGRLTAREREVALLAANGNTSPEIATRLYVSVRTVHTHLQRVYRKLGVNDRAGLARVLEVSRGTARTE